MQRIKPGHKTISAEKQLLIALWKMATPDTYRYVVNIFITYFHFIYFLFFQFILVCVCSFILCNISFIYRSICTKFNVSRATALNSVRKVTKALMKLAPTFITWPQGDKAQQVMKGFYATSAFPKIIGAIDGTHINITAPHNDPECYVNRKGHHSIHLQVNRIIIEIFILYLCK